MIDYELYDTDDMDDMELSALWANIWNTKYEPVEAEQTAAA